MVTDLRRSADAEAQRAMRALVEHTIRHPDRRDPLIEDVYSAAERVRDAVDEWEHAKDALAQRDDAEAPDYFDTWTEADRRWAWGDR